uniref:RHS repeat domain-containing protein n=1 Tax=Rheinheimera sp. TaxID=1869214 RepID=UPI004048492F
RGQATKVVYANGVTEDRSFDGASGWLDTLTVKRGATHVHNMDYNYDYVGNVTQRQLNFGNVGSQAGFTEIFGYDDLHRVTSRTISAVSGSAGYSSLPGALKMNESYRFDHFGNMTFKTNVGNYCYDSSKTNRLTGVWSGSNCTGTRHYNFSYDNNGNVTNDGKRSFTYTAFDKPARVTQGANRTDFTYGPNRELYRRTDVRDNKTTDTLYIGGLYERVSLPTAVTEHKFYVGNAVITKRSNNAHDEYYLHKDGQGSTTSITNAAGSLLQQFIYDPWGKQYSVSTNSVFTTYSNPGTSKGYTGHNMVNDFEVIHMGGRTYNPILGRFMQADPFIQAPSNLQNYNRYSYVLNNPMSYTDPSGYFSFNPLKKLTRNIIRAATKVFGAELVNFVGTAVASYFGGPWGAAAWTYEFNRAMGASSTGALRSAVTAAASAFALQGIGESSYWGQAGTPQNIFANAMVGGISAELQGGKFGHGFISAGVASAFKPMLNDIGGENSANAAIERGDVAALELYKPYRIAGAAIIGGTASVISGGKFANGAITGAFTQMYNGETQNREKVEWVKANPEHASIMRMMQGLAQDSADEYDSNCMEFKCSLPWIRGTGIHKLFADKVRGLGSDYHAEVSYKDGVPVFYGTRGSIRADAIYGAIPSPELVFELKTGWGYMSRGEAYAYFENIPRGHDPALVQIKVH